MNYEFATQQIKDCLSQERLYLEPLVGETIFDIQRRTARHFTVFQKESCCLKNSNRKKDIKFFSLFLLPHHYEVILAEEPLKCRRDQWLACCCILLRSFEVSILYEMTRLHCQKKKKVLHFPTKRCSFSQGVAEKKPLKLAKKNGRRTVQKREAHKITEWALINSTPLS